MALQKMTIRTRLFRHARPESERENVVVSRIGEAWRSMEEFQAWARRTHAGSCALIENGVTFVEHLGRDRRCVYEITLS